MYFKLRPNLKKRAEVHATPTDWKQRLREAIARGSATTDDYDKE